jgi:hypothetical protein
MAKVWGCEEVHLNGELLKPETEYSNSILELIDHLTDVLCKNSRRRML